LRRKGTRVNRARKNRPGKKVRSNFVVHNGFAIEVSIGVQKVNFFKKVAFDEDENSERKPVIVEGRALA
jgi:hypothetical protein